MGKSIVLLQALKHLSISRRHSVHLPDFIHNIGITVKVQFKSHGGNTVQIGDFKTTG